MSREKRRQYRSQAPGGLSAQIRLAREQTVPVTLIDVSGWGAQFELPLDRDPQLENDTRIVLQLSHAEQNLALGAIAAVRSRRPADGKVRYGLEFTDLRRLHRFLPKGLRPHFNRRRVVRLVPPRKAPLEIAVAWAGRTNSTTAQDVGFDGIGLRLPPELASTLTEGADLPLAFELPDGCGTALLGARVIHVNPPGAENRCGLAFIECRTPASVRTHRRISEYAVELQRQGLERQNRVGG